MLLLTGVTGLHFTILLFFGIGLICYSIFGLSYNDRVPTNVVLSKIALFYPYFLAGYSFISYLDFRAISREKASNLSISAKLNSIKSSININKFNLFIYTISFIALLFSELSFVTSGIGTFIPVLSNFLYPICILIAFQFTWDDTFARNNFIILILTVGIVAFASAWRSQLIFLFASILIGFNLKHKINPFFIVGMAVAFFYFILPFQQIKKSNFEEFNFDAQAAFEAGLDYTFENRIQLVSDFFSERINYCREMGYVQNAIDNNQIQLRNGETYKEIFLQLIPRFLWSSKPSYNTFTGYEIPRKVDLLSYNDEYTSWAVTAFAEFIYNYSYKMLPLFIFLLYFLLKTIDNLCSKLSLLPHYAWLLQTTFFFLSLNLVSVIYSSTYFLWTFIVILILNWFEKQNYEISSIR